MREEKFSSNLDPVLNTEVLKALIIAAWYLDKCGEHESASNIRHRIFGWDPLRDSDNVKGNS